MDYKIIKNIIEDDGENIKMLCPICGKGFEEKKKKSIMRVKNKGLEVFSEDNYQLACCNKTCSNKQAQRRNSTRKKIENTNLERYGYKTFLELPESNGLSVKAKEDKYGSMSEWASQMWRDYEAKTGYSHNMKNPESLKINQERRSKTLKSFTRSKRKQWAKKRFEAYQKNKSNIFSTGISNSEREFKKHLSEELKISFKSNPILDFGDRLFVPDLVFSNKKIIEFYGDYWHANPLIYSKKDSIRRPGGKIVKVANIWKKDAARKKVLEAFGYKMFVVWEKNFKTEKKKVTNEIKEFLNG